MYKICVFGGTTEGRELVEFLNAQPCEVTACVATEYGQALLPEAERLTVSARRLPADEIKALLTDRQFDLVIDATHPYAASITKSIARACAETGVERWRLLRGASDAPEDAVFVESTEKAIEFLDQTEGNILLTTGSKELKAYSQIKDFAERVYARVLPLEDSLVLCREAGVKAAHILAMQGPFSEEMNTAMLRAIGAKWLVTKDGGAAGGFAEKAAAAAKTGVRLLVIGRDRTFRDGRETLCAVFVWARAACLRCGHWARQRGGADGRGPCSDRAYGLPDRRGTDAGGSGPARSAARRGHRAGRDRGGHCGAPGMFEFYGPDVRGYGIFQRHEETAPAAAEVSCPRVAGVELDELSLRAAREAL